MSLSNGKHRFTLCWDDCESSEDLSLADIQMIADALAVLRPDSLEGCKRRDTLEDLFFRVQ
jgi:hypothetical protein